MTIIRQLRIAYLVLLCGGILLCYSSFAVLLSQGKFFARYVDGQVALTDFINHYNAGFLFRDCKQQHLNIYDPDIQLRYTQRVIGSVKTDAPVYIEVPPYAFAFLSPCSWLPTIETAWIAWSTLGFIASGYAIFVLLKDSVQDRIGRMLAFACIFASYPMWLSFGLGQTSLYILPAFVLFWKTLRSGKYLPACIATAIISVKLQYVPVCAAVGCALGRWKFFTPLASTGVILLLLGFCAVGADNILNYPHALLHGETSTKFLGSFAITMPNLRGALTLIAGQNTPAIYAASIIAMFAALGVVWLMWHKARTASENALSDEQYALLTAITFPLMLLTSLHAHEYDFVYMIIPCLLLWPHRFIMTQNERRWFDFLVVGFAPLSWVFRAGRPIFDHLYIQPFVVWGFAIAFIAAKVYVRNAATSHPLSTEPLSE